ncbi:unnamed protein product, partial [Musa acuminata subsp. burmannicoides]
HFHGWLKDHKRTDILWLWEPYTVTRGVDRRESTRSTTVPAVNYRRGVWCQEPAIHRRRPVRVARRLAHQDADRRDGCGCCGGGGGSYAVCGATPPAASADGNVSAEGAAGCPVAVAGLAEVARLVDVVVVEVAEPGLLALAPRARQRRRLFLRLHPLLLFLLGLSVPLLDHRPEKFEAYCFLYFCHQLDLL